MVASSDMEPLSGYRYSPTLTSSVVACVGIAILKWNANKSPFNHAVPTTGYPPNGRKAQAAGGDSGEPIIIPGKPEESMLISAVMYEDFAYGGSDELGAEPVKDPVHLHDLHATILRLLGFDHTKLTYRYNGRDFRLTDNDGQIAKGIIA